jgi:hypothetical protein
MRHSKSRITKRRPRVPSTFRPRRSSAHKPVVGGLLLMQVNHDSHIAINCTYRLAFAVPDCPRRPRPVLRADQPPVWQSTGQQMAMRRALAQAKPQYRPAAPHAHGLDGGWTPKSPHAAPSPSRLERRRSPSPSRLALHGAGLAICMFRAARAEGSAACSNASSPPAPSLAFLGTI